MAEISSEIVEVAIFSATTVTNALVFDAFPCTSYVIIATIACPFHAMEGAIRLHSISIRAKITRETDKLIHFQTNRAALACGLAKIICREFKYSVPISVEEIVKHTDKVFNRDFGINVIPAPSCINYHNRPVGKRILSKIHRSIVHHDKMAIIVITKKTELVFIVLVHNYFTWLVKYARRPDPTIVTFTLLCINTARTVVVTVRLTTALIAAYGEELSRGWIDNARPHRPPV
mmetsp:Transcript_26554/g.53967  ORF Transcript_26554/g.53967 Transcript_26554/m.53967 type:complete len:232 (+) Transcript_26554:1553-2248(+)